MGLGLGLGIWWPIQTSIIPGILRPLKARATYFENVRCTTATLKKIENIQYTAPAAPVGFLASYPGASAAYSLRNLIDTTTNVVRVRRSTDNTEQNFTATQITDGTLTTFTGSGDGLVTIWYDQSGNSLNLLQSSATSQPQIVDNGALRLENGLPVVFYHTGGAGKNLKTSVGVLIEQPTSYFSVAQLNTGQASFLFDSLNSSTDRQTLFEAYQQNNFSMEAGTQLILTTDTNEFNNLFSSIFNGSNSSGRMNGIELVSGDAGERKQEWGTLGRIRNQGQYNARSISEFIIYENDESGNQIGIENNISNYYINSPTSGFLSDYPTASAAYSLRSLANNVTNVIRVRRSNDNTEQDFTATQIIDGTLTTFTGANDGCVTTWYNQTRNFGANNQDVTQTTASRQPKIVVNGVLQTKNSKPTLIFNKANSSSLLGNEILRLDSPNDFCSFGVGALNDNSVQGVLFSNTSNNYRRITSFLSDFQNMILSASTNVLNNIALEDNLNLITSYRSGNIINGKTNGTELNSVTAANNYANDRLSIGIQFANNTAIDGCISEIIIYPTDQSSNITGIETNINNEYTIY